MASTGDTDAGLPLTELHCQGGNRSEPARQRASCSRHLDYMLTMVGYCVALGNLLRFPYICNGNGGGIGVGSVLVTCANMPYYNLYLAWPVYYMVKSCSSVLPWTTCGNSWNTDLCAEDWNTSSSSSMAALGGNTSDTITAELWENVTLAHTPAEEFWQYNVLSISTGLDDVGSIQWHIVGCLFASYVIIFLCLIRGIKSAGKAVYVTALLPYILLVSIFITTLLQPGALDGLHYYVIPDFNKLLDTQVWLEACLQVFYSLGPGFGMIGTAASYKNFHEPCLRDCLILTIISEGTSIFSGLVTFATLGVMSKKTGVPFETVVSNVSV
ncbi:sodium- and chloride-dependent creatine transporter 1-like [Haliotis cracherodii]|uniref:sodium- and chloride-dependent creatine transporter 1-like n=1 Tax=Haliotis cracherodii TaxID=6455 RepID=UPI0039EB69C5